MGAQLHQTALAVSAWNRSVCREIVPWIDWAGLVGVGLIHAISGGVIPGWLEFIPRGGGFEVVPDDLKENTEREKSYAPPEETSFSKITDHLFNGD